MINFLRESIRYVEQIQEKRARRKAAPSSSYDVDCDLNSDGGVQDDGSASDVPPVTRRSAPTAKAKAKPRARALVSEDDLDSDGPQDDLLVAEIPRRAAQRLDVGDMPVAKPKSKGRARRAKSEAESDASPPPRERKQGRNALENRFTKLEKLVEGLALGLQQQLSKQETRGCEPSRPSSAILNIEEELEAARNSKCASTDDVPLSQDVPPSQKVKKRKTQTDIDPSSSQQDMPLSQKKKREEPKKVRDFTEEE